MSPSDRPPGTRAIYQVSELNEILRSLIEDSLPRLWVEGEISNFSRPASGHWYFTLKDAQAQIRCAMFRNANLYVRPRPQDGDRVLLRAQATVYPARGELQLICEHLEPAGQGALLRAFEELKHRLAAEGLFDEALKRPLPRIPRRIGLITSATGAAVQDVLSTLARRFPLVEVCLYPVPVQGTDAAPAMVRALRELPQRAPVDVILLVRGGGSLEDLWAFNDERLARAIRACAVPVVSGVGHEIDFTIADFAADLRAPTPTAAAEHVSPDLAEWRHRLAQMQRRLGVDARRALRRHADGQDALLRRLQLLHPGRRLQDNAQRLDELALRLQAQFGRLWSRAQDRECGLRTRLAAAAPRIAIQHHRRRLLHAHDQLEARLQLRLEQTRAQLLRQSTLLASLNPRAVLERGYAVALDPAGHALTDAAQARIGEALRLLLHRGALDAAVTHIIPSSPDA